MKTVFFGPGPSIMRNIFYELYQQSEDEHHLNVLQRSFMWYDFHDTRKSRIRKAILSESTFSTLPSFVMRLVVERLLHYDFLKIPNNSKILFAFTNSYEMWADAGIFRRFVKLLKQLYPNARFALYLYDALDSLVYQEDIFQLFDLKLTFNRFDKGKYGFQYYGPVHEMGLITPKGDGEECDMFYAGNGKDPNRVQMIWDIYTHLVRMGKKCIFHVHGIEKEVYDRIIGLASTDDGFSRFSTRYLSYAETLPYLSKANVLLEVIHPENLASCTARLAQAMQYQIKLLTNSRGIAEEPYYTPKNISIFETPESIDIGFLSGRDTTPVKHDFSAMSMIHYMERELFE